MPDELNEYSSLGHHFWRNIYGNPVVAMYSVIGGVLHKLPVTTVASDTLNTLTGSSVLAIQAETFGIKATDSVLQ